MIAYGCCVGWWDELQRYVVPWVGDRRLYGVETPERPLLALAGQTSIAVAYNTILSALVGQYGDELDAVILLHTDLEILDPQAEQKILEALAEPDVALVGVCGGGGELGTSWWDCNPIGHQQINDRFLDFGTRIGDVDVLEGSLLAFSPWAARWLRFDESYPGFHGYDSICLSARSLGKRCNVVDVDTFHHANIGFKTEQSAADWATSNALSREIKL